MSWVIKLSLLRAVLIRAILTDLFLRNKGEYYMIDIPKNDKDYCLFFRLSEEENLLLWNTSNPSPDNSTRAAEFRGRLELKQDRGTLYIRLNYLIPSDSGQYRMKCWRDGRVSHQHTEDLLVCSHYNGAKDLYVNVGETVELQCDGSRDGDNLAVQWFQDFTSISINNMEKLDLHYKVTAEHIRSAPYTCLVLERQLCCSFQYISLSSKICYVVGSVGEEAVLPCFNPDYPNGTETTWYIRYFGNIRWDFNLLTGRDKQMYVTDGRRSGNHSLVITSLMLNHSGKYTCNFKPLKLKVYDLLVFPEPESEPLSVFFSEGEDVVLRCDSDLIESDRVVWYRRTAEWDNVFLDTEYPQVNLAQDLDGRINASDPCSFVVLANVSLMDTGEYWCGVFYEGVCVSVTKTLLLEWDPFGDNSMFYRVYSSLMLCALLGMVCVLITAHLKTRRRDQASLKTWRTAAQRQTEEQ